MLAQYWINCVCLYLMIQLPDFLVNFFREFLASLQILVTSLTKLRGVNVGNCPSTIPTEQKCLMGDCSVDMYMSTRINRYNRSPSGNFIHSCYVSIPRLHEDDNALCHSTRNLFFFKTPGIHTETVEAYTLCTSNFFLVDDFAKN